MVSRAAGADTLLLDVDHNARAANYDAQADANASRKTPALEPLCTQVHRRLVFLAHSKVLTCTNGSAIKQGRIEERLWFGTPTIGSPSPRSKGLRD